jgi:hypothetical protein
MICDHDKSIIDLLVFYSFTVLIALHRRQHLKKGRDEQTRMLESMKHFVQRHSDLHHVWMKTFEVSTAADEGACEVEIATTYQKSKSMQIRLQEIIGHVHIPFTQSMVVIVIKNGDSMWRPCHSCNKPVECEQSSSGPCAEPIKTCKFWTEFSSILTTAVPPAAADDQHETNRLETLPLDCQRLNMMQLMSNIEDLSDFGQTLKYWPEKAIRTGKQYFEVRLLNDTSVFVGFQFLDNRDDAVTRVQPVQAENRTRAIGRNPNSWSFNVRTGHARAWDCNVLTEWPQANFTFPGTIGVAVDAEAAEVWFYWQGRRICRSTWFVVIKKHF